MVADGKTNRTKNVDFVQPNCFRFTSKRITLAGVVGSVF